MMPRTIYFPNSAREERWIYRFGKYIVLGIMAIFFIIMVIQRKGWCFLDHTNLPLHEFGHLLFRPFGDTLHFLGGTIGQLIFPLGIMIYFIIKRQQLGAAFCLFWFGENFLNIGKYVADARAMSLPLVGGGIHDWNHLLGKWRLLRYDERIGEALFVIGVILMSGAMIWAFFARPSKKKA